MAKKDISLKNVEFVGKDSSKFTRGEEIIFKLSWKSDKKLTNIKLRAIIRNGSDIPVGTSVSSCCFNTLSESVHTDTLVLSSSLLTTGRYFISLGMVQLDDAGNEILLDHVSRAFSFEIIDDKGFSDSFINWTSYWWGNIHYPPMEIK